MQVSYASNDSVQAKAKQGVISLGAKVTLGDYVVEGAGEYDVAGIQCETHYAEQALVYLISAEDLTLTFVSKPDPSCTKVENIENTNILVIDLPSDVTMESVKGIIKAVEPAYVLLIGSGATPEFTSGLGLPPFEGTVLKTSRSGLPIEGTFLVPRT
jgi:hypothetical protein